MLKAIILISFLISSDFVSAQKIEGHYQALELNSLSIDTNGHIYFYGIDSFPSQKWFYEVNVKIKGNQITLKKIPVVLMDTVKSYSTSDGGFITYSGKLKKYDNLYIAKTKMIYFDYLGFSIYSKPQLLENDSNATVETIDREKAKEIDKEMTSRKYDKIKKNGNFIYFEKGLLRKDYVIRLDNEGIWINNEYYRRQK